MDANYKRHGKKSDKETQSPVLKVFQDMMQKEKNDSEKSNLLKEKQDKKRRQHSGLRMKHNHKQRGHESSSSDRQKLMNAIEYKDKEYAHYRTQSIPFQDEKKESWWFWGGEAEKKRSEDTCSCVSCALKKIISSEYTCMACLGVVFLLSVVAAFMMVFKTVPMAHPVEPMKKSVDYYHANTYAQANKAGFIPGRYNDDRLEDGVDDSQSWSDIASRHLSGLASMTGYTGDINRDWSADEVDLNPDSQLSSVLDAKKINEGLNTDSLRSFYKKLLKTDAEICNLKKGSSDIAGTPTNNGKFDYISERKKRSLRFGHPKFLRSNKTPPANQAVNAFNLYYPPFIAINSTMKNTNKTKRFVTRTNEPTGFVVEKKQVIVHFKPNPKKVPKCSHTPKDSIHKSHEKQMKHPFYKHTQRLDELLDQLLDRSVPELMADPFGVDTLFKKAKEKVSERGNDKLKADKDSYREILMNKIIDNKKEADANFLDILSPIESDTHLIFTPTTTKRRTKSTTSPNFNVLLSVSTVINPLDKYVENKQIRNVPQTAPNLRKLMQTNEEDDEGLRHEDVNEVLADESETIDEKKEGKERRKRMKEDPIDLPSLPAHSALNLHNLNWKGPMPLYPDELISMIKQAAIDNLPYNHLIKNMKLPGSKDKADTDYFESSLNDMEYIENYSDKKNEGLMEMAQAYSDYGVLDEKKASLKIEKNSVATKLENGKKSSKKRKSWRDNFFDRLKKNTIDGFRFEPKDETSLKILKTIGKHVKFGVPEPMGTNSMGENTPPDFAFSTSPQREYSYEPIKKALDDGSTFTMHFPKAKQRRLLSIDETNEMTPETNRDNETAIAFEEANKSNISYPSRQDFLKAVLDLNINNMKNSTQASNTDLSDLFMMISSWFSALAASAFASNNNISLENNSKIMRLSLERRSPATILENNKSFEVLYPNYNAEMIENIGHRSRVLLSVEDLKPDDAIHTTKKSRGLDEVSNNKKDNAEVLIVTTVPFSTLAFEQMSDNITSADLVLTTTNELNRDNKSIVKRNANEGSNLVFWNDIYDDEYGVKLDPLELSNNVRAKQINTRGIGFVKKSGNWLQNKVRNIANNIKAVKTTTKKVTPKAESTCHRVLRSPKFYGVGGYPKYNKYKQYPKRSVNVEEGDTEKNNGFEALTKKMKEVCKEAAQAVQQTRNTKSVIRRSEKDDVLSTSLMQQLVRLMTDVIDYKVREKTCLRLPPDLQEFLEWITSANNEKEKDANLEWKTSEKDKDARSLKVETSDEDIDQPIDPFPPSEREDVHTDTRSDCLGTIHAVEDLMKQYDEMSEIDKIKMNGIREYLENQLQFLHKHLANYDDYKMLNYYQDRNIPYRFKRYAPNTNRNNKNRYKPNLCQDRRRRYKRKFIKSFSRKRTRSTASIYDGTLTAELLKTNKPTRIRKDDEAKPNSDELNKADNTQKRNLKDVYFKAIADAKKYTTLKNLHMKTEIDGFDNAKIVRIEK